MAASALHAQPDLSKHVARMVEVERGVRLEVLDWGGAGRPLVLLTGLGDDAHVFDAFAPKLTGIYHVYGVSRRGRGASSKPEANAENYSARRLGEDVLAVVDALHLEKPVVAGHSIAGEELSYIGSHHPEKVAGLVYIEAGYPYALYDTAHGELELDAIELRRQLRAFTNGYAWEPVKDSEHLIAEMEAVEKEIRQHAQQTQGLAPSWISPRMTPDLFAVMEGREKFTSIGAPALVIFGVEPGAASGGDPSSHDQQVRQSLEMGRKKMQIEAWKLQVPGARMVLIPGATHYVYRSNEAEVLRAMQEFLAALPAR